MRITEAQLEAFLEKQRANGFVKVNAPVQDVLAAMPMPAGDNPMFAVVGIDPPYEFECFVEGEVAAQSGSIPVPGKGKAAGRHVVVSKGSKGFSQWRRVMTDRFESSSRGCLDGPLATVILFLFPRHKYHAKLGPQRHPAHTSLDADKCERAVNDSLTKAGVIADDKIICYTRREKWHAAEGETPGVHVAAWRLRPDARRVV